VSVAWSLSVEQRQRAPAAGVVAVNDQAAQPLDARPGVPETLAVGGVG